MKVSNEFKITVITIISLLFLFLLYYLRDILTPVFISMLIAYILDPLVDRLEKYFSRTFSIIILILIFLVLMGMIIFFVIPAFIEEFNKLSVTFPNYLNKFKLLAGKASFIFDKFQFSIKKFIPHSIKVANNILNNMFSIISNFLNFLLVPIFTFYFLKEFDDIKENIFDKVPEKFKDKTLSIAGKIDKSVSSFVRGQLLICIILAFLYSAGLLIVKLDLALIIGIFSGFASIIPYFGFFIGLTSSVLISFVEYHNFVSFIQVIAVFGIVQMLESFIITPKILGDNVGIHPVVVILSLMIFGKVFGFIGLIIAIPLAATLKVFYDEIISYYKSSKYFKN